MRTGGATFWRAALVACLACGERSASAPAVVSLGGDAARVGNVAVPMSLVYQVARSRGLATREALEALVEDALLAQAAKAARLDAEPSVGWASATTLAKLVADRLFEEARARGAPIDDEFAKVRVVHAVVLRSPTLGPARASEIAGAILQAAVGARNDEDFEARTKQVPHPGAQVIVERLPEFDVSGRATEGNEFDATFAAAAFRLRARGETSGIVETPFGWHVIRLMDRVPPDAASLEPRRNELAAAVVEMRARGQLSALLHADRLRMRVEISAAADELMVQATAKL